MLLCAHVLHFHGLTTATTNLSSLLSPVFLFPMYSSALFMHANTQVCFQMGVYCGISAPHASFSQCSYNVVGIKMPAHYSPTSADLLQEKSDK